VYARGGGGGSQQREVADGADVVFTDTGTGVLDKTRKLCYRKDDRAMRIFVDHHHSFIVG